MIMSYLFTAISANRTTGPVPTVTSAAATCPSTCALRGRGCYAEHGPLSWIWKRLDYSGLDFPALLARVRAIPRGQLWRWGQAGDLPGRGLYIDRPSLLLLASASHGKPCLAYTHKPVMAEQYSNRSGLSRLAFRRVTAHNRSALRAALALGFRVNISCDTLAQARKARRLGFSATLIRAAGWEGSELRDGLQLTACPQKTGKVRDCLACKGLCARERDAVIVFPAHGSRAAMVSQMSLELS